MMNFLSKATLASLLICLLFLGSCQQSNTLFELLSSAKTNITFNNKLDESGDFSVLKYGYFYNGGGVAAGDFNNDGLTDLYFTGNIQANKLYLNKGDFEFKDITETAGVAAADGWNTGVSVVDINGDGWLDIYVCRSAANNAQLRRNLLFINNKQSTSPTFTEKAAEYGLADDSYSTQAAFFDYDRDGDLDVFLLNHSVQQYAGFSRNIADFKQQDDPNFRSKLMRNDNGKFAEVSKEAGLISNVLSFGLGVAISDFNNDGWLDLYISNDYNENDYFYLNQQNGTFRESVREAMGHTSLYSMGSDAADINNDGLTDLVTLDMLPESNKRLKLTSGDDNYDKYQSLLKAGFHHQTMRNMLQLNNGNTRDGVPVFSEIGQLSGISNTDWSWAALFADYDNDGLKDLFITNGYARDYTNMEFLKYSVDVQVASQQGKAAPSQLEMIEKMPPINQSNYLFRNNGNLTFEKKTEAWGFDQPSQSNGAVYADLDNDGDLDLVVNNVNEKAFVYRNNSEKIAPSHYIQVALSAPNDALKIGATVRIKSKNQIQSVDFQPVRGFQSSMYAPLHLGLGKVTTIDTLRIRWVDGRTQTLTNLHSDQRLKVNYTDAKVESTQSAEPLLSYFTEATALPAFTHQQESINDFKIQPLLPEMLSNQGPSFAKGDINGDGLDDLFVGGGRNQAAEIWLQTATGLIKSNQPTLQQDAAYQDADACFFDADGDRDLDLAVVSAGYALGAGHELLKPRLYINEKGSFKRKAATPNVLQNASCVSAGDADGDGDLDLFISGSSVPGRYPEAETSLLWVNNGRGSFTVGTLPAQLTAQLITDALWSDVNRDGRVELITTTDWGGIQVFDLKNKTSQQLTDANKPLTGRWKAIQANDLDGDGDADLVVGNVGYNNPFKATVEHPVTLFAKDFSNNGAIIPVLATYEQASLYPFFSRDEMLDQLPSLKKKYSDYTGFSKASLSDILPDTELKGAFMGQANQLASLILWNENGRFIPAQLPIEAQVAPVYAIGFTDANDDGKIDLILGGNTEPARVRFGKCDANFGQLFLNTGNRQFKYVNQPKSGFWVRGDVRSVVNLNEKWVIWGRNGLSPTSYRLRQF